MTERTADNWEDFCHSCGAHFPGTDYEIICGECLHGWKTAEDLIQHDYLLQIEMSKPDFYSEWRMASKPERSRWDSIYSCPCCGHDF